MRCLTIRLAVAAVCTVLAACEREDPVSIPYSPDFVALVENEQIDHATVSPYASGAAVIMGRFGASI